MKKVFSIILALALVLTGVIASTVPTAAVQAPIYVTLTNPIAKEVSNYTILFHNVGTLDGATDWIDVMFPFGTSVAGAWVKVSQGPTKHTATTVNVPIGAATTIGPSTIRITVLNDITKCEWVKIECNATNPLPCSHHLEVGTSSHTPVDSNAYTVYCMSIPLSGGVMPWGAPVMNLISIPCYPTDTSIEVVFKDLFVYAAATADLPQPFTFSVWYWDAVALEWLIYASDTSFDSLTDIEPGKAYWIKPSEDYFVRIHGYPYPPGQGPPEKFCWYVRSWNMVGIPCTEALNFTHYLAYTTLPPLYTWAVMAIWGFNATTQSYYSTGWPYSATFNSTPGAGYWMAFLDAACIIPPPDCDC